MRSHVLELARQIDVILEVVLGAIRVEDVSRVTDGRFADRAGFDDGVDRHAHIGDPVERVENAEHVNSRVGGLFHEGPYDVIGVVRVTDGIRGPQQHLKQNVRNFLAQLDESIPRRFF